MLKEPTTSNSAKENEFGIFPSFFCGVLKEWLVCRKGAGPPETVTLRFTAQTI